MKLHLRRYIRIMLIIGLTVSFLGCATSHKKPAAEKSLYHRIGGYDAVAAVVDDFMGRLTGDPALKHYFDGMDKKSGMKTRQLIVDMVCNVTGGPCYYTGRDMVTTHTGMGITEAHWEISVQHFIATLDKFNVPGKEKNELLAIVGSLEGDIVGK